MFEERELNSTFSQNEQSQEKPSNQLDGLVGLMEIAGAESIEGAKPVRVILGYEREE